MSEGTTFRCQNGHDIFDDPRCSSCVMMRVTVGMARTFILCMVVLAIVFGTAAVIAFT